MFRLTALAAVLVCVSGAARPPVPLLDGRIVGGIPASILEAPYQVALLMDHSGTGSFSQVCGGAIIARDTILTAAHCTDGSRASQWKIRASSTQHNSGGQVIQVREIIQHPGFNSRLDFDISILKLASPLSLGTTAATATLPAQGLAVADGASAFVTGWGTTSQGGISPSGLYKVTLPIVNQTKCVSAYSSFNQVTSNMICAGRLGIGGMDACQGDSGGPLTVNGILIGITSWGRGCASSSYPGVWTRVPAFRNWINSNM